MSQSKSSDIVSSSWSTVDGQGGSDEDVVFCGTYDNPDSNGACTFPWYSYNGTDQAIVFGGAWSGTTYDENTYHQFATTPNCSFLYCATRMPHTPPIP